MRNRAGEIAAQLRADWPAWHIWLIYPAVGGITWCAQRRDGPGRAINASSATELEERLAGEEEG